MSAAFTPGPWVARMTGGGSFEIHDGPECWESTVLCSRYPYVERKDEMEANARLIAAAPDLLAALQDVEVLGLLPPSLLIKARAAIAKAIGGQP